MMSLILGNIIMGIAVGVKTQIQFVGLCLSIAWVWIARKSSCYSTGSVTPWLQI